MLVVDTDASSVSTGPVANGQGGRPRLVAGLVIVAVAVSVLVARFTPDPQPSQAVESARPTAKVAPVEAVATPMPQQEWFSGPDVPLWDDVLVETGQVRWLRLGKPRLTAEALARPGRDLLLRAAGGGTVCLCWQVPAAASLGPGTLDFVRTDSSRSEVSRTTVLINEIPHAGHVNGPEQAALAASPDGQFAYLARTERSETAWRLSFNVIDLRAAAILDEVEILSVPQNDPSEWVVADRPLLRIAWDGRHALVLWSAVAVEANGRQLLERHAWIIDLDGPTLGRVVPADAVAEAGGDEPGGACPWTAIVALDIVARGCRTTTGSTTPLEIHRFNLDGGDLGSIVIDPSRPALDAPLLDVMAGLVYGWDPVDHTLLAVDLASGGWRTGPPLAGHDNPVVMQIEDDRPPPGAATFWSDGRAATDPAMERTLVGSPDGRLLFAIGTGSVTGASSGILVFDAETLRLLERWPARASYRSVTVFGDGRWLAALGRPGVTASGGSADWSASVTIHHTISGVSVLRIGDLSAAQPLEFLWPGPVAASP